MSGRERRVARKSLAACVVCHLVVVTTSFLAASEPIKLHPDNPHYFLWRGKPTVLITSGEHYGAVLNRDFDFRKYLKTLESHGFNLTRVFSGAYCEPPGAFDIKDNTLAPGGGRLICPWARSGTLGYAFGENKFDLTRRMLSTSTACGILSPRQASGGWSWRWCCSVRFTTTRCGNSAP